MMTEMLLPGPRCFAMPAKPLRSNRITQKFASSCRIAFWEVDQESITEKLREHTLRRRSPIIEAVQRAPLAGNSYLNLNSNLTAEQEAVLEDHCLISGCRLATIPPMSS